MRKLGLAIVLATLFAFSISAGAQAALQNAFLGKEVEVKIDMPATQQGVDLNFSSGQPLDWRQYSQRIKQFGIALRKGEAALVLVELAE